ncbi:MAG TPA: hypothetical protein VMM77_03605, partial [Gemmatimonadaceae bacterium]|nr:hypothetical protein [Gemmatimonadaceae bacterium]
LKLLRTSGRLNVIVNTPSAASTAISWYVMIEDNSRGWMSGTWSSLVRAMRSGTGAGDQERAWRIVCHRPQ